MVIPHLLQIDLNIEKPPLFHKIYGFGALQNVLIDVLSEDGVLTLNFGLVQSVRSRFQLVFGGLDALLQRILNGSQLVNLLLQGLNLFPFVIGCCFVIVIVLPLFG